MTIGFVFVDTKSGGKINFKKELGSLGDIKKNVLQAYSFAGNVYDFALKVEGENQDELKYFRGEIENRMRNVKSTFLLVVNADRDGPIGFNRDPENSFVHPSFRDEYKKHLPQ